MVDWDEVERLRAKGVGWDRIASDPKVGFHADDAAGDPGRALRAVYYRRKAREDRRGPSRASKRVKEETASKWTLPRIGFLATPLVGVWFGIAWAAPSPVGVYLPAIPWLGIGLAVAAFVLIFGLWRSHERWNADFRGVIVGGVILGLVIAGGVGVAGLAAGCPYLPPLTASSGGGWQKVSVSPWTENGLPVFYFYGSAACPYCSASSWAMWRALLAFGTISGNYTDTSNPNDVYPNTPEMVLANAVLSSKYVALQVSESTYTGAITAAPTSGCVQQAYVNAYSGGSIPYVVVNGQYVHAGSSLVDPAGLAGMTPSQVESQVYSQSGAAWSAIAPQVWWIEAYLVKSTGGQPTNVATNPNVAPLLSQI